MSRKRIYLDDIKFPPIDKTVYGGILPAVNVTVSPDEWLEDWYKNRKDIIKQNIKNYNRALDNNILYASFVEPIYKRIAPNKYQEKYVNKLLNEIPVALKNTPEYIVSNYENYQNIPNINTAPKKIKNAVKQYAIQRWGNQIDKNATDEQLYEDGLVGLGGFHLNNPNVIVYSDFVNPNTRTHEKTHSLQTLTSFKSILDNVYSKEYYKRGKFIKSPLKEEFEHDSYLDKDVEIQSRLNSLRYYNNLNPKKKYTIKEIRSIINKDDDKFDLNRYNDEFLLHLFNEVADNGKYNKITLV